MSDQYNDSSEDDREDGNEDFKNLRAKAKKADQYEREMQALKRELAFVRAGVPLDDPKMTYFIKGYDGELEPDAIKTAAIEAGFMAAPQQQADPLVEQAKAGQAAVIAASSGSEMAGFDEMSVQYAMDQAYAEGGIEALSDVAQQYGVTFQPDSI